MISLREAEFKARIHKALFFDGNDDYIVVTYNPRFNKQQITIIGWVSGKGFDTSWRCLVHLGNYPLATYEFAWNVRVDKGSRSLWFRTCDGTTYNGASIPLEENELAFFAFVHDNGVCYAYKNGKLVEYKKTPIPQTINTELYIGSSSSLSDFWRGIVKYIAIYDRALSESEIKYLYHNPFDILGLDNLVLWLTPASIDTVNGKWWDLSKYGNHGTIYGATEVKLTEEEVIVL